ncbi:MAG: hypothetical protein J7L38_08075 [Thermoproteales archaeon]|nr:hypothetical protein [Thermoproteales archaeon]
MKMNTILNKARTRMNNNISLMIGVIIPLLVSYFVPFIAIKWWIKTAKRLNIVGRDMNKPYENEVPEAGGVWVTIGIAFGLLFYVALRKYITGREANLVEIMAIISLELLAAFLGLLDDVLGWKKGLKPWQKIAFTFPIALPLIVVRAGYTTIELPVIGVIDLGPAYSILLVPIGVVGAANGFNMLAGYNGLEAGMGTLLLLGVLVKALQHNRLWIAYMALIGIVALIAFLYYNWFPAKVFPGDSLTHPFGAFYASLIILGNMEKFGMFLFIPYFLDALLYFKAKIIDKVTFRVEAFAKVHSDGSLSPPYDRIYDTTHLAIKVLSKIKGKVYERDVVLFILGLESIILVLGLIFL